MADSETSESVQMEGAIKSPDKEQPESMDEKQSTGEVQEEAPKACENGQHIDEPVAEGENKEEQSEDTKKVEQTEETVPKDTPAEDSQQQAESEEPKESEKGHGATVAKHYNEHKENTREERKTSPIFYLRNFNNWVKSVLINEFMEKYKRNTFRNLTVLDLACGKGGDLLKWQKARISNLICADIAEISIKQCEQRYKELRYSRNHRRYNQSQRIYDAQFITADCSKEDISDKFISKNKDVQFDMTSCQFSFHYAFESAEQAEKMLQNACERLKPGGYFIGTIPCANEILKRLRQSEDMSFGNDCYKITFTEKENISLFGHKYDFHLEGVVDCPEFVVYFPLLEKMAAKFDMTLELAQGFHNFFEDHKDKDEYKFLLNRMNALETYPPRRDGEKSMSEKEGAYAQAEEVLGDDKDHGRHVGTLSEDEWAAAGLYMVFAFKKAEAPKPTPVQEAKTEEQSNVKEDDKKDEVETVEDKNVEGQQEVDVNQSDEKAEGEQNDDDVDKSEDVDKKDGDAEKMDEDAENVDGDGDKMDEDADKKDEDADKKDEDVDKKDEAAKQMQSEENANTEVFQGGEAGEQGGDGEESIEAEKKTPARGGRRKRSAGAAKDEAGTPEESNETTPKRGTRKRKSTGAAEEEPPEKKKA